MSYVSIGDQSRLFLNRRQNTHLKTELQRLAQEMSSGRLANPATKNTADTAHLLGIERSLTTLSAYRTTTAEADHFLTVGQEALNTVTAHSSEIGPALLAASSSLSPAMISSASADGAVRFAGVVSAFNVRAADRAVFGGSAVDRSPLADPGDILAELKLAIAGQTTADGIAQVVDDWFFAPSGGFETMAYQGSTTGQATFRIADGEDARMPVNAQSDTVRSVLTAFALAALINAPELGGNVPEKARLALIAGENMVSAEGKLATGRADIGGIQSRLDSAQARNASQKTALDIAYNAFTAADPYQTATELEEARTQLETLYTITARISRLSLAEYL